MTWTLIIGAFTLTFIASSGHWNHGQEHSHTHDFDVEGEEEMCTAHTRSHDLMSQESAYQERYHLENAHADEYVSRMRQMKHKNQKMAEKAELKRANGQGQRDLLFSEYDDEIDNSPIIRIPLVYHVLYDSDILEQNLSDEQLQSQLDVLNNDFRANNSEVRDGEVPDRWSDRLGDAKIQFDLAGVVRKEVNSSYVCANDVYIKNSAYGGSDQWNASTYLNVWLCHISRTGTLGYAYYPCLLGSTVEFLDGVVLSIDVVGSEEYDPNGDFYFGNYTGYKLGRVLTHEVGHYLNMVHIWGDQYSCDATNSSDFVSDTPLAYAPNFGCPNETNSCNETDPEQGIDLPDMTENYMDYTLDACHFMFTEEQVWRMRAVLAGDGCRQEMYYNGVQLEGNQTLQPSTMQTTAPSFECDDGCELPEDYVSDGYCDCSNCEDEEFYTCDSCPGCPEVCYDYVACVGSNGTITVPDVSSTMEGGPTDEGAMRQCTGSLFAVGVSLCWLLKY